MDILFIRRQDGWKAHSLALTNNKYEAYDLIPGSLETKIENIYQAKRNGKEEAGLVSFSIIMIADTVIKTVFNYRESNNLVSYPQSHKVLKEDSTLVITQIEKTALKGSIGGKSVDAIIIE